LESRELIALAGLGPQSPGERTRSLGTLFLWVPLHGRRRSVLWFLTSDLTADPSLSALGALCTDGTTTLWSSMTRCYTGSRTAWCPPSHPRECWEVSWVPWDVLAHASSHCQPRGRTRASGRPRVIAALSPGLVQEGLWPGIRVHGTLWMGD
jgi:hypothetical protein